MTATQVISQTCTRYGCIKALPRLALLSAVWRAFRQLALIEALADSLMVPTRRSQQDAVFMSTTGTKLTDIETSTHKEEAPSQNLKLTRHPCTPSSNDSSILFLSKAIWDNTVYGAGPCLLVMRDVGAAGSWGQQLNGIIVQGLN